MVAPAAELTLAVDMHYYPRLDGSTMKLDPRNLFRAVAIAESVSWAGLLLGMYFKRIAETTEMGVVIFAPIHGVIVLAYLVAVYYGRRWFRWDTRTALLAAFASIPPLGTVVFEVWADRRNLLRTAVSFSEEKAPAAR